MKLAASKSEKLLDAISALKRATGIPGHPRNGDTWLEGTCYVHTTDADSAKILSNLVGKILTHGHTEKFWKTHAGAHDLLRLKHLGYDIYRIDFPASERNLRWLTQQVEETTQTLIAPDVNRRTR